MELDKWQTDVLNTNGNIALRSGRQVGKSTVISIKSADYAVKNPKRSIMIISATERQAYLLFSKVLAYIHDNHKALLKSGKDRPTKSEIKLKNGSIIRCLPTGLDGLGIRGYTVDLLIADEAAFIPQDVWSAVTPMLSTTGGSIILLSTPHGKSGYFYEAFQRDDFTKFHVSTEQVAETRQEPQRTQMLEHLQREKKSKSALVYSQEYLGEFIDELRRVYSDEVLKKAFVLYKRHEIRQQRKNYLGVDCARMGSDPSAFRLLDGTNSEAVEQIDFYTTYKTYLTETAEKIKDLDKLYNFRKIGIDTGGLGSGVFDWLLKEGYPVLDLDNARRDTSEDKFVKGKRIKGSQTKLMKEAMHMTTLRFLERGHLKLLKEDEELWLSLASFQFELDEEKKKMKIVSSYNHPGEALIRAVWPIWKEKSLNLWVEYN